MTGPVATKSVIAVSVAAFLALIGAVATAEAGHSGGGGKGGGIHMGGSAFKGGSAGKFRSNQGGKFASRSSGAKFHTNQGGKNRGWSGKYDNHHGKYGHYRRYGYPWYGLPLYSYSTGGCGWLYRKAIATDSDYWWNRYNQCTGTYY